jgi:hypothetical protein
MKVCAQMSCAQVSCNHKTACFVHDIPGLPWNQSSLIAGRFFLRERWPLASEETARNPGCQMQAPFHGLIVTFPTPFSSTWAISGTSFCRVSTIEIARSVGAILIY